MTACPRNPGRGSSTVEFCSKFRGAEGGSEIPTQNKPDAL